MALGRCDDRGSTDRRGRPATRPRYLGALAAVAVTALVLAGCGGSSSTTAQQDASPTGTVAPTLPDGNVVAGPADTAPVQGGKLVYGIDAEPESLDPVHYAFSQAGHAVASAVFDPLATLDADGKVVPYLATGFEHSADNMTWTIGLPTGVTFHDGTKLDADAVVQVLQAYKDSAIDGAALITVSSITAKDPTHVVVTLSKPWASFPALFTTQAGYIIAPSMLTNAELGKKPVGSGPFVFSDHVDGKVWSFKKNPNYRQPGLPHLDDIEFIPEPDPGSRNDKLATRDLDVIQTNGGPQIIDLRATGAKLAENRYGDKSFLILNTTKPPFDSVTARRAVAFATNASRWRKDFFADVAGPANSPYGPDQPGYLADNGFPSFDLAQAKKLAAQYQTETGQPLTFTILAIDDPTQLSISQAFAADYTAAGMVVSVDAKPQINLLAGAATGAYQMSQFRVFAQPNPDADVHFYRSTSIGPVSLNFPRYANPDVDAAIDQATATLDEQVRATAYEKVNRIFAEQVPYVWLGQEVWMVAANPNVNGVYAAANGSIATVGPKTWIAGLSITR